MSSRTHLCRNAQRAELRVGLHSIDGQARILDGADELCLMPLARQGNEIRRVHRDATEFVLRPSSKF